MNEKKTGVGLKTNPTPTLHPLHLLIQTKNQPYTHSLYNVINGFFSASSFNRANNAPIFFQEKKLHGEFGVGEVKY